MQAGKGKLRPAVCLRRAPRCGQGGPVYALRVAEEGMLGA
jgi:hypothetical protein